MGKWFVGKKLFSALSPTTVSVSPASSYNLNEQANRFLCCYSKLLKSSHEPTEAIIKGKGVALSTVSAVLPHHPPKPRDKDWVELPLGWVKISVDGSFKSEEGTMVCGIVLRDEPIVSANGTVLSQSCNML
jgi:hypothetical protein